MSYINKRQNDFLVEIFGLFLGIRGLKFLRFERYGKRGEQGYRSRSSKDFDFLSFNGELVPAHGGERRIIAIDPSYVRKSGKPTPGAGYFWSGTHQANISPKYLEFYLCEYAFRFIRKLSTYSGKLFYSLIQQSVMTAPSSLKSLKAEQIAQHV